MSCKRPSIAQELEDIVNSSPSDDENFESESESESSNSGSSDTDSDIYTDNDENSDIDDSNEMEPRSTSVRIYEDSDVYIVSNHNTSIESEGTTIITDVSQESQVTFSQEGTEWCSVSSNYKPMDIPFTANTGILGSINLTSESQPIDFFEQFLNEDVVNCIVEETNKYAEQFMSSHSLSKRSRANSWCPVNNDEMKKFIGLIFSMGLVKKPKIEDYWTTDPLFATPGFRAVLSRDRFKLLLQFLHFSDNEQHNDKNDRLIKIRHILDLLLNSFSQTYLPNKELSVDEALVLWRGRLAFRQYIPGKRHRYGVKLYMLCEQSGYCLNNIVYWGKMDKMPGFGHAETVVLQLMEGRFNKGHHIYTDNYYTSVHLARELLDQKTHLCGTVRTNRKEMPSLVCETALKSGEMIRQQREDIVEV